MLYTLLPYAMYKRAKNLWKHPLNSGHSHLNETTTLDYHQFGNVIMSKN